MKYIVKQLICVIFLMISSTAFGQENANELETMYMDCMYDSCKDNGVKVKAFIKKTEDFLIEKKLLKDDRGESYIALYKNLKEAASGKFKSVKFTESTMILMEEIDFLKFMDCNQNFVENLKIPGSRMNLIMNIINAIDIDEAEASVFATIILKFITAKDLEHDFYKYVTFGILESYTIKFIENQKKQKDLTERIEEGLGNALHLKIEKEELFINDKKKNFEDLQKEIITYVEKNKSSSIIAIKYNENMPEGFYAKIDNEIMSAYKQLKNKAANEKFTSDYDKLTKEQQEEIDKIYPLKIKDSDE